MNRPHLLFFTHSLNAGGAEQFVASHIRHINRERYRVSMCVLHEVSGPSLAAQLSESGIPIFNLAERSRPDILSCGRLLRLLRSERVDLIQSHQAYANCLARLAASALGTPVITTEQTTAGNLPPALVQALRFTLPLSDCAVYISQGVRDSYFVDALPRRPPLEQVIPNGIEWRDISTGEAARLHARDVLGLPADALVVGTVGRLVPVKGQIHLINAWARLKSANRSSALLVLIGTGQEEARLRTAAQASGIAESVIFAGHRPEARRLLAAFDLFAMPSLQEGLGIAALEAMAAGLPVVASQTGGLPEIVQHERTGFLVAPGDEAALADAMLRLLASSERRRVMGDLAKSLAFGQYTIEASVRAYDSIYETILRSSVRKRQRQGNHALRPPVVR